MATVDQELLTKDFIGSFMSTLKCMCHPLAGNFPSITIYSSTIVYTLQRYHNFTSEYSILTVMAMYMHMYHNDLIDSSNLENKLSYHIHIAVIFTSSYIRSNSGIYTLFRKQLWKGIVLFN